MTKSICISGYYGFDNFGDETILKILVQNIKKYRSDISVTVFSSNPKKTAEELNVNSVYTFNIRAVIKSILKSDCLLSGGGSLLQDATSRKSLIYYLFVLFCAQFFNKKTIIFAQGIGPVKNHILSEITAGIIKKAKYVTVRDKQSFELLKSMGIDSVLCNDPVWNMELKNVQKTDKTGIQLRAYPCLTEGFLSKLAVFINKYYADSQIEILSFQNNIDLEVCRCFRDKLLLINPSLNVEVIENSSCDKVTETVSSLKTLIAMRYHACLIGIKAGVKVLPLSYDKKVETLAKEFGLQYIDLWCDNIQDKDFEKFALSEMKYDPGKIQSMFFDFESMMKYV